MDLYATKPDQYFTFGRPEMLPFVPTGVRTVLEVGCGVGAFATALRQHRNAHITAIEAHGPSADAARSKVDELHNAPLEDALPMLRGREFDCIVMNDVIEHLADPWAALRALHGFLRPDTGRFVASIPNVRYVPVFKAYVQQARFHYEQSGVMDRTHLRFFTQSSMVEMFTETGYQMERIVGINPVKLPFKLSVLNKLTRGALSDLRFQQFACVARRP